MSSLTVETRRWLSRPTVKTLGNFLFILWKYIVTRVWFGWSNQGFVLSYHLTDLTSVFWVLKRKPPAQKDEHRVLQLRLATMKLYGLTIKKYKPRVSHLRYLIDYRVHGKEEDVFKKTSSTWLKNPALGGVSKRSPADHIVPMAMREPSIGRFFSAPCSLARPIRSALYFTWPLFGFLVI